MRAQDASGGGILLVRRSPVRRLLFCVVLVSLLVQEARALSSGLSLQIPPRSTAFLTAPRFPQFSSWAAGASLPLCRRSPQVPNAAPLRVIPVASVSRGFTSDSRNEPWALHASGGTVLQPPRVSGREQGPSAQMQRDAAWDQSFEELRLVAKANGGVAHVSQDDLERPQLGIWCRTQARRPTPPHES